MADWYGLRVDATHEPRCPFARLSRRHSERRPFGSITIDAFPIDWEDPTDPDLSWEHDDMHMPFALAPLSIDYVRIVVVGMEYGRKRLGGPWDVLALIFEERC